MKNNNLEKRRAFLKNGLKALGGTLFIGSYLSSCSNSLYSSLVIDQTRCIGCGDCDDACNYNAIIMSGTSTYAINISDCTLCNWCVNVCESTAIVMPEKNYNIKTADCTGCNTCIPSCNYGALKIASDQYQISSGCVGCGDCISVCQYEGGAIAYVINNYVVKSNCHGCVSNCSSVCNSNAISTINNKAYIDTSKCTKCGKCYDKCKHSAITKAYVKIDEEKCTHCGKCYDTCTYDEIEKSGNSDVNESYIERSACTNCGECIDSCPENAIYVETSGDYSPEILTEKCTSCGKCFDACTEQMAIDRSLATAAINQTTCMKCNKCFDVCNYDAVLME